MSYILEALKKAQAERQLGSAPTIHAMPIQASAPAHVSSARTPLLIGGACVAVLAAAAAVVWWRGPAPAPAVLAVQPMTAPPPVVVAPPVVVTQAPPAPASIAPTPSALAIPQGAPVQRRAATVVPVAPVASVAPAAPAVPVAAPTPVARQAPPAPVKPAPAAEAPAPEDSLPFISQLPEPIRSEVPKVTFGGYMYSKNPADRLLLIDKVLRHEGEEVAPGLILEQLQSKAAVMNYRGTRYRVAY